MIHLQLAFVPYSSVDAIVLILILFLTVLTAFLTTSPIYVFLQFTTASASYIILAVTNAAGILVNCHSRGLTSPIKFCCCITSLQNSSSHYILQINFFFFLFILFSFEWPQFLLLYRRSRPEQQKPEINNLRCEKRHFFQNLASLSCFLLLYLQYFSPWTFHWIKSRHMKYFDPINCVW